MERPVAQEAVRGERISVVVPMFNAMETLPRTVPALLRALEGCDDAEVLFVDNGSVDGSPDFVLGTRDHRVQLLSLPEATVAALRNHGARIATGEYVAFLDSDCVIPPDYFQRAVEALEATGATATGCEVRVPEDPHWIEKTWHSLHYQGRDRFVRYINSANFFVDREAFLEVGGFAEDLETDEDSEIGNRLVEAGKTLFESTAVEAIHLGNPKTLRAFYRRALWHGYGMFATMGGRRLDRPMVLLGIHGAATLMGLATLLLPFADRLPLWVALAIALLLQLLAPGTAVLYRALQLRKPVYPIRGTILYWVYLWARLRALAGLALRRRGRYWKS
jgi:glycosyltransferase involved in cell wall biosynthesis